LKTAIYETAGRAREYSELALNLFNHCDHSCIYCYAPNVLRKDRGDFNQSAESRLLPLDIEISANKFKGENRRVLLCFTCDPYQDSEKGSKITRTAIEILHEAGLGVIILTKGGIRSMRDFDLLKPGVDAYATTLTLNDPVKSNQWEPGAALPVERIYALEQAHKKGIETWVSFEPVIYPQETFKLLELTHTFVDHYKVGTMNYHPQGKSTDWKAFGFAMKRVMDAMGVKYYFKNDLLREMGILPAEFKQKVVCR